jgi:hypothetical protein
MQSVVLNKTRICRLVLCALVSVIWPSGIFAQGPEDNLAAYLQLAEFDIRAKTMQIVSSTMNFTEAEGAAFWPLYRKYEFESGTISDRMISVIKDYKASLNKLDDAKADDLADRVFKIDEDQVRLYKKYYKEFSRVLPPKRVLQLFQLFRRIDTLVDLKIAGMLPMIGEDW